MKRSFMEALEKQIPDLLLLDRIGEPQELLQAVG